MEKLTQLVKNNFTHFTFFYAYLRHRIFVALGLSLAVGVLDGLGLAMFLPLLEMVNEESEASAEGLGNLRFLVGMLQSLGVDLTISSVLIVILVFFTLKGVARFFETYYKVLMQQYFIRKLRHNNINKLSNYSYKAFAMADSGRIQNTLSGEIGRVAQANYSYFAAVQAGVLVLVYLALALLSNPQFALLVAAGGALSNLAYRQIYKKTVEASRQITSYGHEFHSLLIQTVSFFKYLKATGLNRKYANKLKKLINRIEKSNKRIGFYNSIMVATREPLVILVVVAVIIVQVTYFSESLGLIILSLLFFYRSLTSLMALQNQWNSFLNVSGSLENMTAFMDELSAAQEKTGNEKVGAFSDSIEIRDLTFNYGTTTVLKNINLKIRKNETIAFVGESGSGKTTLVNILAGLMPVDKGEVLIDGVSFKQIDTPSFQRRTGYITQEPVIFSESIYNNVTFWAEDNPENKARFWKAIRRAAIEGFVRELPDKEHSLLGYNGMLVSGGQKQRLSIARELYKDIDILIMDEATSALDSETEKAIQENIDALKGYYTILIVAHRLATVKSADKIVLLQGGEVAGVGAFDSLSRESEIFHRMVSLQEL